MPPTKILIVEDEIIVAENLKQRLIDLDYQVLDIVSYGEKAIPKVDELEPDLILMDIRLKGAMLGTEAAEKIHNTHNIPIIFVTSHVDSETLKKAKITEPFGYIVKPYRTKELHSSIEMAMYKHRLDQKLRASEARYRAIVEDQSELICRFLADRTLSFANKAYCDYFGKSREELIGEKFTKFIHPDDAEFVTNKIASLNQKNRSITYEHRVIDDNGNIRWQQWNDHMIIDENDNFIEYQSVGRDITERKIMEEKLKQREEYVNALMKNASDIISIHDENGIINFLSPNVENLLGYTPQELLGENLFKFMHPDDVQLTIQAMDKILDNPHTPHINQTQILDSNGDYHHIESIGTNFLDNPIIRGIVVNSRDVTYRKKAEQKIRESEERFRYISELVSDYMYVLSMKPNGWLIREWVSDAINRITGYTFEELDKLNGWQNLAHPDDREEVVRHRKAFKSGKTDISEYRIVTKDGSIRWLRDYTRPIWDEEENRVVKIVGAAQDITKRKLAEKALRQSEKKYKDLVETIDEWIWEVDRNGKSIYNSPKVKCITGYEPSELHGKMATDLMPASEANRVYDFYQESISKEKPFKSYECVIHHKNGEEIIIESSGTPFFNGDGTLKGFRGINRDITDRKKAEEALKKSEREKSIILNSTAEMVAYYDKDLTIQWANKAAADSVGKQKEDLVGDQCYEIWHNREEPCEGCPILKALETKQAVEGEMATLNGQFWYLRGYPVFDENNEVVGLVEFGQNITEKKIAQEELNRSRERFRKLYENATIGLYRTTPDGKVLMANPALVKMLGYESLEELSTHRNLEEDGFEPDYPREDFKRWLDEKGEIHGLEEGWRRKDGTTIYVRESARVIRDEDGKPVYYEGTVEDITERKLAEMAKRESEEKYRTIFLNAPLGIFRSTPEGKFLEVNPVLAEMLGYNEPQEVLDNIYDIAEQIYIKTEKRKDIVKSTMETQNVLRYVNWYKQKDGTPFVANLTLKTIFDKAGNILYLLGIVEDITERQKAQEQIRKSLREKVALLKEIHHRVKNNMQVISSLLYIQSQKTTGKKCRAILQETQERVKSMALVHEKMYKSKDLAQIDISEYIHSLASELFYAYKPNYSEIRLHINAHNTLMRIDTAIPCGLIINELVTNALKHGFPECRNGKVAVEFFEQDNEYILIVADDGINFPENIQIDTPQSMGLELIKDLTTEQLKGNIELDRTNGATFKIIFPKPD